MTSTSTTNKSLEDHIQLRLQGLFAGGFAGAFAKTATAPFDRVKILCQTGRTATPLSAVRQVYQQQGIVGFWRGNTASVLRIIPNRGVLFMSSDFIKDLMHGFKHYPPGEKPPPLSSLQYVCAGALSGAITVMTTYPLDFIRGRMTGTLDGKYTSIVQTFRRTVAEEGWRTLYRGMSVSLIGAFPYEGIRFGVYDSLKSKYMPADAPIYYNVVFGAIAGLCATVFMYPNDTVRRRLQVQEKASSISSPSTSIKQEYYKGGLDAYRQLYRNHGIRVFYGGLTVNLARAAPSAALQFGSFELIKKQFSLGRQRAAEAQSL